MGAMGKFLCLPRLLAIIMIQLCSNSLNSFVQDHGLVIPFLMKIDLVFFFIFMLEHSDEYMIITCYVSFYEVSSKFLRYWYINHFANNGIFCCGLASINM